MSKRRAWILFCLTGLALSTSAGCSCRGPSEPVVAAAQPTKNLLDFLRSYAISTTFHDASRIKYWTSIDRNLIASNRVTLSSGEAYAVFYDARYLASGEGVQMFRPVYNVFGAQTGLMAANRWA